MKNMLGEDLKAILVYDVGGQTNLYEQNGFKTLGVLQEIIEESNPDQVFPENAGMLEKSLREFTNDVKANGEYAVNDGRLMDKKGNTFNDILVLATSGFLEGAEGDSVSDDGGGDDLGLDLGLGDDAAADGGDAGGNHVSRVYFVYSKQRINTLAADSLRQAVIIIVVAALLAFVLGLLLAKQLTRPIDEVVEVLKDIAEGEGDLSVRLTTSNKDEMGELAQWFNLFVSKLNDLITRMDKTSMLLGTQLRNLTSNIDLLQTNVNTTDKAFHAVAQVAESLQSGIGSISSGTETSHGEMEKVASGAKEMSEHISEVANSVEQSTRNLADVASAVEQLSATLQEISRNMDSQ